MRKIAVLLLTAALFCCLCACTEQEETKQALAQMQQQLAALEQDRLSLAQETQALHASEEKLREEFDAVSARAEALSQEVERLNAEIERLTALDDAGEMYFLGHKVQIKADQKDRYLPLLPIRNFGLSTDLLDADLIRTEDGEEYYPMDALTELYDLARGTTPEGTDYLAVQKQLGEVTPNRAVPVMMYHAVSDDVWGIEELFVSPAEMEKQLKYLTDEGYETIFYEDLTHLEDFEKPILLTFDDGYEDNFTELLPLLQKYNAKATFFVIGGAAGGRHKMSAEQIYEAARSGLVSIQSHGYTHHLLGQMERDELEMEMTCSRDAIAALTGEVPYALCYPEGNRSDLAKEVAAKYYTFGTRMNGNLYHTVGDLFEISRFYVARSTSLDTFASYCAGKS